MSFAPIQTIDRIATRLRAALIEPARADRAVFWLLAFVTVVWTAYATIEKWPQGLHPDMTELVAWSRDLSFGYLKHPPLAAWLAAAWFAVFPVAEWSYYLLAALMPALALWIIWKLSADYLDIEKRVVGLLLLMLVPFFNFHALKYNVNTVLMPLWAATTLCFLRSYRTQSLVWAALAGVCAAAAMLGKYWSVFLLAGLVVAALADQRRLQYFRSPAPWVTIVVGALLLAPHIWWLVTYDFAPFKYAMVVHGEKSLGAVLISVLGYLGGSFGYIALPLIAVAVMARAAPQVCVAVVWPRQIEMRLVAMAFWLPFLLPAAGAIAGGSAINSLWSMSCWTLLPILLLSPVDVVVRPADTKRLAIAVIVVPVVLFLASPAIAIMSQRSHPSPAAAHASLLAKQVEEVWRLTTPEPLRFVGGEADIAYGVATYSADRPRALTDMPQPSAANLARSGAVYVCFAEDQGCRSASAERAVKAPGSRTVESTIVRGFLRILGAPQRYTIIVAPPQPQ